MADSVFCPNGHSFPVPRGSSTQTLLCPTCSAIVARQDTADDADEILDPADVFDLDDASPKRSRLVRLGVAAVSGIVILVAAGSIWTKLGRPFPAIAAAKPVPEEDEKAQDIVKPFHRAPPPPESAIEREVAALPFPPMTDPAYGPPSPRGKVVSRAMINGMAELALDQARTLRRPVGRPPAFVEQLLSQVATVRRSDPSLFCLPPSFEKALLSRTPDMVAVRIGFERALTAMGSSTADAPLSVFTRLEEYSKNRLSAAQIVYLTEVMEGRIRRAKPKVPVVVKGFLEETRLVGAGEVWARDVALEAAGRVRIRVSSTGAYSLRVLTDETRRQIEEGETPRTGILFDVEPRKGPVEQMLSFPAGTTWIEVRNEAPDKAEIRVQCFRG